MAPRKKAATLLDDASVDDLLKPMPTALKASSDIIDKELLITSSLLDSIDFYTGCPIGSPWKAKSLSDLHGQLSRAPWSGDNKFTERGMKFEAKLCAFIKNLKKEQFYDMMRGDCLCDVEKLEPFYDHCKGGKQQETLKESVVIDGQRFCLYGKADILFPGISIKDIKTTSSGWKEGDGKFDSENKYRAKNQHLMYNVLAKTSTFDYLVAEFIEVPAKTEGTPAEWKVIDVHVVDANTPDLVAGRKELYNRIKKAMDFLRGDPVMWQNYCNVFTRF